MFLKKLEIENFRNIKNLKISFNKNINIFIGNNAQGKTNILESIYFLSITKSHRTHNDLNLIMKGQLYNKVSCIYEKENTINTLSIFLNEKGKKVSVDNIMQKKISNYLSRLNVIMFCPDDLDIVKSSPSVRRRFLNIELSQFRKDYVILLKEYNNVLKQRNEYLKQKNNFDKIYFDILTEKIIEFDIKISMIRYEFIDHINKFLSNIYKEIAGYGNLTMEYKCFIKKEDIASNDLKSNLKKRFEDIFQSELIQKTTLYGIHKDDFKLYLDDFDIFEYCSQGQQRMSIISLKLAEIEVFSTIKKIKPIILLDDIFSELDEFKKNNIIKYFNDDLQIFITTTDIKDINISLREKSDIYMVNNGIFVREEE